MFNKPSPIGHNKKKIETGPKLFASVTKNHSPIYKNKNKTEKLYHYVLNNIV